MLSICTMSLPVCHYFKSRCCAYRSKQPSGSSQFIPLSDLCLLFFSHCLYQAKTESCKRERSPRRVAERKRLEWKTSHVSLFHGRIETLKLRLEAPPLNIVTHKNGCFRCVRVCACVRVCMYVCVCMGGGAEAHRKG